MVRYGGSERGIALLATMLAVALMTLLVVDFATTVTLGYRAAQNQADELRASYLARSGIGVGLAMLEQDSFHDAMSPTPYDALNEPWAQPIPPIPLGGGTVSVTIVDEARKFNVNGLIDPQSHNVNSDKEQILGRLVEILGLPGNIVPEIEDWLDPDSIESPGGAEESYYLTLKPPYEPRNGPMPTIGDLRALKGMDDMTFLKLTNYLTVSQESGININTASPELIMALSPEFADNPQVVKEIVTMRMVRPFTNTTDVGNLPGVGQFITAISGDITTRSNYFTIIGQGDFAGARRRIYATFQRDSNGSASLTAWHED
ncbi:MAG TPA: type II secretion system minor pseudopilin GspK [Candidatus Binataceae bacterium]|nr:type II secretion system minor pseudopilin GspK [Candidatus Binataceae bacterium]